IYNQRDYDVRLELVKPDFGFLRAGFTQYPKYYEDMGGYYGTFLRATNGAGVVSPFAKGAFSLNKYPQLDIGKIYFDAGLTLPNLPKIEFGYEHQYKDGTKNLLEWGTVTGSIPAGGTFPNGANVSRYIYPAYKDIDERVDIFKLGVEHTIGPVELGDNFYFEKYSNNTARSDDGAYFITDGSQRMVNAQEQFHHDLFSNTYHMEHHVNDKVYWSMGHLFTSMNGDAGYAMQTLYSTPGTLGATIGSNDKQWNVPTIYLKQDSQVGNFNVMAGPFSDLTAYAGIQGEKTTTDASAFGNFWNTTNMITGLSSNINYNTSVEKRSMEEHMGLRFTKIPYTTVFAEAKWAQEDYTVQMNEQTTQFYPSGTTEDVRHQEYKTGFSTSPLARMTLTGQYRFFRTDSVSTLTLTNTTGLPTPYLGNLHDQSFQGNEISTKLSIHPVSKVTVTLKYQMLSEDIFNTTQYPTPAGSFLQAASYYANIYSLGVTVTPINRLYVTGLISYQDTTTTAFDNNLNAVAPYKGNVYTVNGTVGYVIDNKTDLAADYTYSHTDNYINNGSGTTPGTDYSVPFLLSNDLHGLNLRLTRRISDTISVGLRYGFYKYNESYTGGINDYTAHLASASCTIRF
ncbi:MAG: hypothetical protein NTY01_09890, partial [Verrucomicrobia bacterium]|nr:hypothetical protein [Verrucomicrobiota bacterium]